MKTIVNIHGMWAGAWCWTNYEKFFTAKGYKVVSLELPFHGSQYKPEDVQKLATLGLKDYVESLKAQIAALNLDEKPIIFGHSMGGLLAQLIAQENIGSANVFLAPASPYGVMPLKYSVVRSFLPVISRWSFWKKAIDPIRSTAFYSVLNNMPFNKQDEVFNFFTPESGRVIFETGLALLDKNKASKVDFAKVVEPTLILSFSLDKIVPKSVVAKTAKKYPQATYKNFDNFAHWFIEEDNWQEVAEYIADFLAKAKL